MTHMPCDDMIRINEHRKNDYLVYHHLMYDKMDYQKPRYDEYITQFDDQFGTAIDAQFQYLIDLYFDTGKIFSSGFEFGAGAE